MKKAILSKWDLLVYSKILKIFVDVSGIIWDCSKLEVSKRGLSTYFS